MSLPQPIIVIVASLLTLAAGLPYILDVIRGITYPRLVTWFTWALMLTVGAIAAFSVHQIPAGALMLTTAIESILVVGFGFRTGNKSFEKLDALCLAGVLLGIALWLLLRSPEMAIFITVIIDFLGIIPTFSHAWRKPHEETLLTYILFTISNTLILIVTNYHLLAAATYPAYVFLADLTIVLLIVTSPHHPGKKSASL